MKTNYEIGNIPHSEYPRPQLVRNSYLCLNGEWKLSKRKDEMITFESKIIVPFSPETYNSGLINGFTLENNETLIYERTFNIDEDMHLGATVLHFGAVDSACLVYINNKLAFTHRGGYTPFEVDIAEYINIGENKLLLECTDTTELSGGARGKQSSTPGGIWYTAQSGIWQSVWLESMPREHIGDITVKTDPEKKRVCISTDYHGKQLIRVFDDTKVIFEADFCGNIDIAHDFLLWSPESPKLYDFEIVTDTGDLVRSYFGVRSFSIGKDRNGKARLVLNGEPYFMSGVLDQGYWPDGSLTYPSDMAIIDELTMLKKMGFNMIRKHIKIEPLRWYYHCDRLGFVVWQDFVNGGGKYKFTHVAAFPFLGFNHDDSDYKYFARESKDARDEFEASVYETVSALKNCTSIGVWVPFNEGWGQFDSHRITQLVRSLDDTRIIDSVSGWHDQGIGKTDLKSMHTYYTPLKVPKDKRPVVLSEFGGYSLKIDGHVFNPKKEFGYKKFKNIDTYCNALEDLYINKVAPLIEKGLSACVYTQVSDVEEEINGLVTYDRAVIKIEPERMCKINQKLYEIADKLK